MWEWGNVGMGNGAVMKKASNELIVIEKLGK